MYQLSTVNSTTNIQVYGVSVMGVEGGSGGIGGKGSDERGRRQSGLAREPCGALPTP